MSPRQNGFFRARERGAGIFNVERATRYKRRLVKPWSAPNWFSLRGRSAFNKSPRLGWAFFEGELGLPKDPARARYWLKKIVDDECEYKHFNNKWMAKSAEMLRELDA